MVKRWDDNADLAKHGVGFLLWGLLDVVVDSHFDTVESLDTEIEELEDLLFDNSPRAPEVQRRSFELRKSLVMLRRVVLPTREVLNALMRRESVFVDDVLMPYYQDVYDHVLRAADWTDSLRDLVSTILETNLTIQGNRMNEIMKAVTSWAAIAAVPTIITGYYGMNVRIFPAPTAARRHDRARADGRRRRRALRDLQAPRVALTASAVVLELQRDAEVGLAQHRDDGLKVVALLRRDPHRVALHLRLHALRPVGLDPLDDRLRLLVVDALPDRHQSAVRCHRRPAAGRRGRAP